MPVDYPKEEIEAIRRILIDEQKTIAVAESVTSGLLQGAFSQATDARLFFQGGITTFNVAQKCRQLNVEPIHALEHNGVSFRVANQMAEQVTKIFCSQLGLAVVGYAAPVPVKKIEGPYAYYAIYGEGRLLELSRRHNHFVLIICLSILYGFAPEGSNHRLTYNSVGIVLFFRTHG